MGVRLGLLGAALVLVGLGLGEEPALDWFDLIPLIVIVGAGVVSLLAVRGEAPDWGGGALVGLGAGLAIASFSFVISSDEVVAIEVVVQLVGAIAIAAAGLIHWTNAPAEGPSGSDWWPAAGAVLVTVAAFTGVNKYGESLGYLAEYWGLGGPRVLSLPVLLLAAMLLLSLFPTPRPRQQVGLAGGVGLYLFVFFLSLAVYLRFEEETGTGIGIVLGLAGSGLVVARIVYRIRKPVGDGQAEGSPEPSAPE